MSVQLDTQQVRDVVADLRTQRDALTAAGGRCVALDLPGAGADVAAQVARLVGLEQALTQTVAAALDGAGNVLAVTAARASVADVLR